MRGDDLGVARLWCGVCCMHQFIGSRTDVRTVVDHLLGGTGAMLGERGGGG